MRTIEQRLTEKLRQREQTGSLRQLTQPTGLVDFCSNDYLGLACDAGLHARIGEICATLPKNGSTGSRLLSGNTPLAEEVEAQLADIFRSQRTLLFNSGYAANTAILSAVPGKGDTILYDEKIHASLKEGARLSFAKRFSFRHNDLNDLEKKLRQATGEKFVVAESVYSMDGDAAPLRELLTICQQFDAHLIWDEAHSTGIWGERGSGVACAAGVADQIFARIYTFGKAMGVHGACVAGSRVLTDYLVNFARPFIYTTALPVHSLVSIREAFNWLINQSERQEMVQNRISYFRKTLSDYPHASRRNIPSYSPIQVIRIGGNSQTRQLAVHLQQSGFDVRPILSPTVPEGEERLRICLHSFNTEAEISRMVSAMSIEQSAFSHAEQSENK